MTKCNFFKISLAWITEKVIRFNRSWGLAVCFSPHPNPESAVRHPILFFCPFDSLNLIEALFENWNLWCDWVCLPLPAVGQRQAVSLQTLHVFAFGYRSIQTQYWALFYKEARLGLPFKAPEEGRLYGPSRCRRNPAGASGYRSIQTQYWANKWKEGPRGSLFHLGAIGFEPTTSTVWRWHSPAELHAHYLQTIN